MLKPILLPFAALAALSLSACGGGARNEAAAANETMEGDANTMAGATADVNAALDAQFDAAENRTDAAPAPAGDESPAGAEGGNEVFD